MEPKDFLPMECFKIEVFLKGTVRMESPECPACWRNSGVYDIDVPVSAEAEVVICHNDLEAVKKMLEEYEWPELDEWPEVCGIEFGKVRRMPCDAEEVDTMDDAVVRVVSQTDLEDNGPDLARGAWSWRSGMRHMPTLRDG